MKLCEMTSPEVRAIVGEKVALLPLGAIEQHGPHLPVTTDADIVTFIAEVIEKKLPSDVVLCPTLSYGSSHHHLEFSGTMSIAPDLFTQVVVQLIKSLLAGGFQRIVLLNGHGGNVTPVRQALALISHEYDKTVPTNIVMATYWELAGKSFSGEAPMETAALCHACEYETSMMLELFPKHVRMEKAKRSKRPLSNGYIPWEDDEAYRGVSIHKATQFISDNGSSGEPLLATVEKGRHLINKATEAGIKFVSDFKKWPLLKDLRK